MKTGNKNKKGLVKACHFTGLFSGLRKQANRLMTIHAEPRSIAYGYALGTFLAATPLIGIHCIIAVALAGILKWNKLAAGIGAFNSNLVTAPFLYSMTYFIGAKTIGLSELFIVPTSPGAFLSAGLDVILALVLGGLILGIPLAVVGFFLSYLIIKRFQVLSDMRKCNGSIDAGSSTKMDQGNSAVMHDLQRA